MKRLMTILISLAAATSVAEQPAPGDRDRLTYIDECMMATRQTRQRCASLEDQSDLPPPTDGAQLTVQPANTNNFQTP